MKHIIHPVPPELQADMRQLYEQGITAREIAERFHCDPRTAMNFIRNNYPSTTLGKRHKPRRIEPYESQIQAWLSSPGISTRQIHQRIQGMGYTGSLRTVQSYVTELREKRSTDHHESL